MAYYSCGSLHEAKVERAQYDIHDIALSGISGVSSYLSCPKIYRVSPINGDSGPSLDVPVG